MGFILFCARGRSEPHNGDTMRTPFLGILLSLLAALGACGKKGPLYLPETQAQTEAAKDADKDAAKKAPQAGAHDAGKPAAAPPQPSR